MGGDDASVSPFEDAGGERFAGGGRQVAGLFGGQVGGGGDGAVDAPAPSTT
ncbi:MAG TPA: hypothetical protein VFV66_01510 [Nonomuraea sp.]|nr:hypothetical protein [Nonomuraea sp.]